MIDLHGASVIETSCMALHLQYLQVVQGGRIELMLATLVAETRALRQQVGPVSQRLEDLSAMGQDIASATVQLAEMASEAGLDPMDAPDPLPSDVVADPPLDLEIDSGSLTALPPGVEPFDGFEPDPDPDPGAGGGPTLTRARPMAEPEPEPEPSA